MCDLGISSLILAGGLGTRLGRVEKALQYYQGQTLLSHVLASIQQQSQPSEPIYLNVNRALDAYAPYGLPLCQDAPNTLFQGPLAGVFAGLNQAETTWLWVVPCDVVYLAADCLAQMLQLALGQQADIVRASFAGQSMPTLALYHVQNCRKQMLFVPENNALYRWQNQSKVQDFVLPCALLNLNTPTAFLG